MDFVNRLRQWYIEPSKTAAYEDDAEIPYIEQLEIQLRSECLLDNVFKQLLSTTYDYCVTKVHLGENRSFKEIEEYFNKLELNNKGYNLLPCHVLWQYLPFDIYSCTTGNLLCKWKYKIYLTDSKYHHPTQILINISR